MAKIVSSIVQLTSVGTISPPQPILAGDTWVFIIGANSTTTHSTISGFTPMTDIKASASNSKISGLYKRYTTGSNDPVTLVGGSCVVHFILRGVPETPQILSFKTNHEQRDENCFGSMDCSGNGSNQLIFYAACTASNRISLDEAQLNPIAHNENTVGFAVGYKTMPTAGVTSRACFKTGLTVGQGASSVIFSIPDDGTGWIEQDLTPVNDYYMPAGAPMLRSFFGPSDQDATQRFTVNNTTEVFTKVDGDNPVNGNMVRPFADTTNGAISFQTQLFQVDASVATCKLATAPNTTSASTGTFSGVASTDVLTFASWTPVNDACVTPTTTANGLTADTAYYVISASGATCKLSTTRNGATAANITSDFASMTIAPKYVSIGIGSRRIVAKENRTFTTNNTTHVMTLSGDYAPVDGDVISCSDFTGGMTPLLGHYYIINASGQTCKLSNTLGGSSISFLGPNATGGFYHIHPSDTVGEHGFSKVGMDVNIATNVLTAYGWTPSNDQRVALRAISGGAGLNATTTYFVINVVGQTFQLSLTSGGAAVSVTTNIVYCDIWLKLATMTTSNEVYTAYGWTPIAGRSMRFDAVTGGSGLTARIFFRIFNVIGQTFQLSNIISVTDAAVATTTDLTRGIVIPCTDNYLLAGNTITSTLLGRTLAIGGAHTIASSYQEFASNINGDNTIQGPEFGFGTPRDLSSKFLSIQLQNIDQANIGSLGMGIILSDGTNWSAFTLFTSPSMTTETVTCLIDVNSAVPIESSGTLNTAAITKIKIFAHRGAIGTGNIRIRLVDIKAIGKQVIYGGGLASPANTASLWKSYDAQYPGLMRYSGRGQSVLRTNIEIGDGGINSTILSLAAASIESPQPFSVASPIHRQTNIGNDVLEIAMNLGASDNISFSPSLYVGTTRPKFTIRATSNNSATTAFNSANYFDLGTWSNLAGTPVTATSWSGCRQILGGNATYTNCSISQSIDTTAAIQIKSGGKAVSCSFTKGSDSYAIQMPIEAGDTTLDISGSTFSGYTKQISILKTTGTVTITAESGQIVTYDTAGATIVINQPVLSTSWTNADLADGTSILVRNITTNTTITYVASLSTGTGYTVTLLPSVDYAVSDVIEIRQSRKNANTYYNERTSKIITSSEGGSIIEADDLSLCVICNNFNLDGADFESIFSLDSTNDEIDIDVLGNFNTSELMVYWRYKMTQQAPMEEFWGAWDIMDDGSFYNYVDVVAGKLDNTSAGDAIEISRRRIHRSDGLRPIKSPTTSGYAIDVSWSDPVTTVETGVSGLTISESTKLLSLDTAAIKKNTDLIPAIL